MAKTTEATPAAVGGQPPEPGIKFDALLVGPSIPDSGKFARWAGKALATDGRPVHVRRDTGPDGAGWRFITADPADTLNYPIGHRLERMPRYDWADVTPGIRGGTLRVEAEAGPGPFDGD